jgi:asparagine synthase (glutamine-hydrolysing)
MQVIPGHYVTFTNGRPIATRWFVQAVAAPFTGDAVDAWKAECRELLKRSLARRIDGKERVGYLLSSGTDTAVNCVVASWLTDNPVNSFTLGYSDAPDMDERVAARRSAEHLKTVHREVETDLNCVDALADITRRTGAPMGNPAALIINEIFRQVSGHVDAVVTGDGGNEVFGGLYEYMRVMYNIVEMHDPVLKRAIGTLKKSLRQSLRETPVETSVRALKRRLRGDRPAAADSGMAPWEADLRARGWNPQAIAPLSDEEFRSALDFFLLLESYWTPGNRAKLFAADFKRQIRGHDSMAFIRSYLHNDPKVHLLQQLMWARLNTYIPYNVLQYVGYNASANGVTPLFPYLDRDFMAYMCRVPIEYVYGRAYRHFMKVCFAPDYLPESLFQKTFRGFNTPIGHWMPARKWRDLVEDHCSERAIRERGIFEPAYVRDLIATYYRGRRDMATEHPDYQQNIEWSVWTLVAFEAFCREFI